MNNLIAVSNPCYGLQADEHFQPSELSQYLSTDFVDNSSFIQPLIKIQPY
ncbi:hypothetical protein FM109_02410 [Vibrio casei]|nr:hypothetical protein FM109_02410 [Vibrio casei]